MSSANRQRFFELWGEIDDLSSATEVLEWDQETYMPRKGLPGRGKVMATLAGLRHDKLCAPELRTLAEDLAADSVEGSAGLAQGREAIRQIDRAVKVPTALTREIAELESLSLAAWSEARKTSSFPIYQPLLERMVELKRQEAACVASAGSAYDGLLDDYEPGAKEAELIPLFADLRAALVPILQTAQSRAPVDESAVQGAFPEAAQRALGQRAAAAFGFRFDAGRLDLSTHPFCTGFNRGDVRMTWRFEEGDFRPALYGILHETGHGLYEQGLPEVWARTPLGAPVSLGIHESQSRLWENLVGRSKGFWKWALPLLHEHLPGTSKVTVDGIWKALHTVKPSLIRVEADEATYNLHVAIRFDIERRLFAGNLEVSQLPEAWDDAYEELLGIRAERVAEGVLQDIHWALGSFGYFPTYTLGTLASCQLFEAATEQLGDLEGQFGQGEFAPLLRWLRQEVHQHGRFYSAGELIERTTGKPLGAEAFLKYVRRNVEEAYPV